MWHFNHIVQPLLAWLHQHPQWTEAFTFIFSFAESIAIFGMIVPGAFIMAGLGALVGAGIVPISSVFFLAVLGAILGDSMSYFFGYRYSNGIMQMWPFRKFPELMQTGQQFFQEHGGKSVFIGRFAGPLRPITPLIAGMLKMPPWRFIIASSISAILYVPAYMFPGLLLGAASLAVGPGAISHLILTLLATVIVIWALYWLITQLFSRKLIKLELFIKDVWQAIANSPRLTLLHTLLQNPNHDSGQIKLAVQVIILSIINIIFSVSVYHHGYATHFNQVVFHMLRSIRNHHTDVIMIAITDAADTKVMGFILVGITLWLSHKKAWHAARHAVLLGGLSVVSILALKHGINFPRPISNVFTKATGSFPSGHTGLSAAVLGFISALAIMHNKKLQTFVLWSLGIALSFIALSRLYLGAHWFSDIIGAFLVAGLALSITVLSYRRQAIGALPVGRLLLVSASLLLLGWLALFGLKHQEQIKQYTPIWPTHYMRLQQWWHQTQTPLPSYHNHLGQAIAHFNLQWAGNYQQIKQLLSTSGWQVRARHRLKGLGQQVKQPLLPPLYKDREPVSQWIKIQDKQLYVLQLWHSDIYFEHHVPLWFGRINPAPKAMQQLQSDLKQQAHQYALSMKMVKNHSLFIR